MATPGEETTQQKHLQQEICSLLLKRSTLSKLVVPTEKTHLRKSPNRRKGLPLRNGNNFLKLFLQRTLNLVILIHNSATFSRLAKKLEVISLHSTCYQMTPSILINRQEHCRSSTSPRRDHLKLHCQHWNYRNRTLKKQ